MTTAANRPRNLGLIIVASIIVLALAVFGYLSLNNQRPAPMVEFIDLQGKKASMQDLRGKVVLVNFWATSCTTCVKEMPMLVETYQKYQTRGLELYAVAMQYDPPSYVQNFAQTRQLPFPVMLDLQGQIAKSFGDVSLTPTTFVIDKQGKIIKRYVGQPRHDEFHKLLEEALKV